MHTFTVHTPLYGNSILKLLRLLLLVLLLLLLHLPSLSAGAAARA
jgi:hypothetical protein